MLETLGEIRVSINAESTDDMLSHPLTYNPKSTNIFDKKLLNPCIFRKSGQTKNLDKKIQLGKLILNKKWLVNIKNTT